MTESQCWRVAGSDQTMVETTEMLRSLTLLLAVAHPGQAGGGVGDSMLLSLLDGLTLIMLGDTRGFNR